MRRYRYIMAQRIHRIEALNSSVNGNPRFRVFFADRPLMGFVTSSDAAFAYTVGNAGTREGDTVLVDYTPAHRIRHMEPAT